MNKRELIEKVEYLQQVIQKQLKHNTDAHNIIDRQVQNDYRMLRSLINFLELEVREGYHFEFTKRKKQPKP